MEHGQSMSAYFPQDHKDGIGEDAATLIEWLYRYAPAGTDTTVIRSMLGRMLFSGDMAQKAQVCYQVGKNPDSFFLA